MSNKLKAVAKGIAEVGKKLKSKSARSGRRGRRGQRQDKDPFTGQKYITESTGAPGEGKSFTRRMTPKYKAFLKQQEKKQDKKDKLQNLAAGATAAAGSTGAMVIAGKKLEKEKAKKEQEKVSPIKKKLGGAVKSKTQSRGNFPDLTGDGKVTKKDVLRGRGVPGFKKGGSAKKKGLGTKWESKWG